MGIVLASAALGVVSGGCSSQGAGDGGASDSGAPEAGDSGEQTCPAMPTPLPFVRGSSALPMDGALRINHLQAKATHNSYHLQPSADLIDWAFSHKPLAEQFEQQGVRGVELDVQWSHDCGRLEVFHIGIFDDRTTCRLFTDCLLQIRGWSASHPGHHPLFIQIEPKFALSPQTDESRIQALEKEILAVFERPWLITPDDVRGASPTLAKGIKDHGWPTLGEARGRVLFFLNEGGALRDRYTRDRTSLDGRLLFAEARQDDPVAGVMILNDPIGDSEAIKKALASGYIVRTRADSLPGTLRSTDRSGRDAALAGGAQIVSTDFPAPVEGVPYSLSIPDGTPSRCSPVTAPPGCAPLAIEDPSKLGRK